MLDITKNMKNYNYYYEGYDSVLHEFIGDYQIENSDKQFVEKYGIKAFHPIAKNYSYSHYDDFGASRSYGYKRLHFGNDLMGSIGSICLPQFSQINGSSISVNLLFIFTSLSINIQKYYHQ